MHLNGDTRQVTIDATLFGILMAYARNGLEYEARPEDVRQLNAIERHAIKFNRHVRENIALALQPGFIHRHKQEHARAVRQWALHTGTKAYLYVTSNGGVDEYYLPVTIMGRSAVSTDGLRLVVVRPSHLNLEQFEALSMDRRARTRGFQPGTKIKLGFHPITGPTLIHACFTKKGTGVFNLAAFPSHLKLCLPEGSHECHGGLLDGVWRAPHFLSQVNHVQSLIDR